MSRAYDRAAWRGLRRRVVEAHVARHGFICPGWGVEPHPALDLVADHVLPVAAGGLSVPGNVQVLCRRCNGRKGDRVVREQLGLGLEAPRRWRYPT